MPKLSSEDRKWELRILNWPLKSFPKLKEANKVKIWSEIYKKKTPDKLEIKHDFSDRYFDLAESELDSLEAGIFTRAKNQLGVTRN